MTQPHQDIELEWIRAQLRPLDYGERISSLRNAVAFIESLGADPEIADRNPPSRPALAWLRHFEPLFQDNVFSTRSDVVRRLSAELSQLEAGTESWNIDESLGK